MHRREVILTVALFITLILFGLAAFLRINSAWGLNHALYLDNDASFLFGAILGAFLLIFFLPAKQSSADAAVESVAGRIWSGSILPKVILSGLFTAVFYFFRVSTAFLGDGYFLLNIFGRNEHYTADLIKPLSILTIKTIQTAFGGFTHWTALYTFQTLSMVAGFFVVYNLITITGLLTESAKGRLFALGVLLGSGWLLLFFGYIEYYPLLWLAASFFLKQAIKCVKGESSAWTVWLWFLIAVGMHAQALYFLPGLLYIHAEKPVSRLISRLALRGRWVIPVLIAALSIIAVAIAQAFFPEGRNPLMPLLPIDYAFPNYAVLSLSNLLEITNLIMLCVPSALVILLLGGSKGRSEPDGVSTLLALFSLGSLFFLVTMNPKLGLARDWDLMSLTLLPPLLFLLHRVGDWKSVPGRPLIAAVLLSCCLTFSILVANIGERSSERRIFDLLEHYGTKERGGWTALSRYYQGRGRPDLQSQVDARIQMLFPDQMTYETAMNLLSAGQVAEAESLIHQLVESQPNHGQYLAALGDIRVAQGNMNEAIALYEKAIKTHPHHRNYFNLGRAYIATGNLVSGLRALEEANRLSPANEEILVELCRGYGKIGKLDKARESASALLKINPRSPDGLIIALISASQSGNRAEASRLYREFLQYGTEHPDYEAVKKSFDQLR
jgi:Flp pilus assembly protein TadD